MNRALIDSHIDEIDSFEACFGKLFWNQKDLIVPYYNLGISDHPSQPESTLRYLGAAYLHAKGITYLKVNQTVVIKYYPGLNFCKFCDN